MKKISIIAPVFEKVSKLIQVVSELDNFLKDKFDYEVFCYYRAQLPGKAQTNQKFVFLRIEEGRSFDDCVTDGFSKADGDCIIVADFNNDNYLDYLKNLLEQWGRNADVVLVKKDDKHLNLFQKIGKLFKRLFKKIEGMFLGFANLAKDYEASRTFQLFSKNVCEIIKEFPEKNHYLRNFDCWGDYRVAVIRTTENIKVARHEKKWTADLTWSLLMSIVAVGVLIAMIFTTGLVPIKNRAMFLIVGVGIIVAFAVFGLYNLFLWYVFRKTKISRKKRKETMQFSSKTQEEPKVEKDVDDKKADSAPKIKKIKLKK